MSDRHSEVGYIYSANCPATLTGLAEPKEESLVRGDAIQSTNYVTSLLSRRVTASMAGDHERFTRPEAAEPLY
jgi:predicted glycosyltransferase